MEYRQMSRHSAVESAAANQPATSASSPLAPLDPLQRYTLNEALRYLRMSRPTLYDRIRAGDIITIRDGGRRYVPGSEIVRRSTLPSQAA
jgi:hypothetical protein